MDKLSEKVMEDVKNNIEKEETMEEVVEEKDMGKNEVYDAKLKNVEIEIDKMKIVLDDIKKASKEENMPDERMESLMEDMKISKEKMEKLSSFVTNLSKQKSESTNSSSAISLGDMAKVIESASLAYEKIADNGFKKAAQGLTLATILKAHDMVNRIK